MDLKYLGRRLKSLRLNLVDPTSGKPLSQDAFSKRAGISRGSVADAEGGKGKDGPCIQTIDKWLRACDTSLKEFFGAPGAAEYKLPFDYEPQNERFHVLLEKILKEDRSDLHQALYTFLYYFSLAAAGNIHPPKEEQHQFAPKRNPGA